MQQGGVISFSDSESFLVRIANIWGLQEIVQCIFCKKSQVKTLKRMFDPFLPFHFHHNLFFDHIGMQLIEKGLKILSVNKIFGFKVVIKDTI